MQDKIDVALWFAKVGANNIRALIAPLMPIGTVITIAVPVDGHQDMVASQRIATTLFTKGQRPPQDQKRRGKQKRQRSRTKRGNV